MCAWVFNAIHIGDTLNLIDPDGVPLGVECAGLVMREVKRGGRSSRCPSTKP